MIARASWTWLESGLVVLVLAPLLVIGVLSAWLLEAERAELAAERASSLHRDAAIVAGRIDSAIAATTLGLQDAVWQTYGTGGVIAARNVMLGEPLVRLATIHARDGQRLLPAEGAMLLNVEQTLLQRARTDLANARAGLDTSEGLAWSGNGLDRGGIVVACRRMPDASATCLALDADGLRAFASERIDETFATGRIGLGPIETSPSDPTRDETVASVALAPPFSGWGVTVAEAAPGTGSSTWLALVLGPIAAAVLAVGGIVFWTLSQRSAQSRRRIEMLAQVSHELRTPLANIGLYGELLARRGTRDPELERYCDVIEAEVERLARLVDNALVCARDGSPEASRTRTADPDALARGVIERLAPLLEGNGTVEQDLRVGQRLCFDVTAFERILINLLDNARKHAPGSRILVGTALDADPEDGDFLVLVVADDGLGLASDLRRRLFTAFAGGRESSGFGLGLAACRAMTDAAGGTIDCEPTEQGARFVVRLPVSEAEAEPPRAPAAADRDLEAAECES